MFTMTQRLTRAWYDVLPNTVTTYAAVLLAAWGMTESRERARRTLGALQLEAQLQTARLAALRAQLQPHFLYNTLNGIAALVADSQPSRAVTAIEQLGELLHASLRDDRREEITVAEEITLAERYLGLQGMRFRERLRYELCVDPEVADCLVPVLLLQPLVENAVIHGLDAGQERITVRVTAVLRGTNLEISVENDGALIRAKGLLVGSRGVGLASTRARLHALHGDRASLVIEPRTHGDGGVLVRLTIPHRTAAPQPFLADRTAVQEAAT
jgi:sensor histidine kinase YesM